MLFSFVDKRLNLTKIDRTKFNKKKTGTEITDKVWVGFSDSFDESFVWGKFWVLKRFEGVALLCLRRVVLIEGDEDVTEAFVELKMEGFGNNKMAVAFKKGGCFLCFSFVCTN